MIQIPQAIIFDMDGVLIDSEHWWPIIEHTYYSKLFRGWKQSHLHNLMGKSAKDIHAYLCNTLACSLVYDEYLALYRTMADEVYAHARLMPNVLMVLKTLKRHTIPTALASSATREIISTVLHRFPLRPYFAAAVSAEDVAMRGKPAPDIYLYTAQRLNITPRECLAIEDSAHGITAAKSARMQVFAYQTPYNKTQQLNDADKIITNLMDILAFLNLSHPSRQQ